MHKAGPWLQAIRFPIRHLQWGAVSLSLLLIRARLGRGQRGVWEAHAGYIGDLERWEKELRPVRDIGNSGPQGRGQRRRTERPEGGAVSGGQEHVKGGDLEGRQGTEVKQGNHT